MPAKKGKIRPILSGHSEWAKHNNSVEAKCLSERGERHHVINPVSFFGHRGNKWSSLKNNIFFLKSRVMLQQGRKKKKIKTSNTTMCCQDETALEFTVTRAKFNFSLLMCLTVHRVYYYYHTISFCICVKRRKEVRAVDHTGTRTTMQGQTWLLLSQAHSHCYGLRKPCWIAYFVSGITDGAEMLQLLTPQ